jgi:uncharacterized protein YjiS (DUF1127 family)
MDLAIGHRPHENTRFLERAGRTARHLGEAIIRLRDQRRQRRAFERLDTRLLADVGFDREVRSGDSVPWTWWV